MRLERQAPFRPLHRQANRRVDRPLAVGAVHRLDQEMAEIPAFELGRIDSVLGPDQLQFVARALDDLGPGLGADADPVEPADRRQRAVGLDRDSEAALVQRVDQRAVELKHRLAAGHHRQPLLRARTPQCRDMIGERVRVGELAAALPVGADEIGVAEIALRLRPVLLAPRPQIAPGEAQEHRPAARLDALALQRQERFLDGVGHA